MSKRTRMNFLEVVKNAGFNTRSYQTLSGGMIGDVYRVLLEDGQQVVAKWDTSPKSALDVEGYMLRYLAENSALPVPQVLYESPSLLVMTYIEGNSQLGKAEQEHAAELVAALHNVTSPQSGMERDTVIAQLHQPNPYTNSWIAFFRDHRLLHMAHIALEYGALPREIYQRIQRFSEKLHIWLIEPDAASLLHGDMWTTNILAKGGQITGFIDPAVYYGHPEIELAFTTLFGTFSTPFFECYRKIRPLEDDFFKVRRDIYNLYPLLVHVRLFGSSYVQSIHHTLHNFGY